MTIKASVERQNWSKILIALILIAAIFIFWWLRPLSWRYFSPQTAVPPTTGWLSLQEGKIELPTYFEDLNLKNDLTSIENWLSAIDGLRWDDKSNILLLQEAGLEQLAIGLIIDLDQQKQVFRDWQHQIDQPEVTRFQGFEVTEYQGQYFLQYANLLLVSPLALVVEECLAELLSASPSILEEAKLKDDSPLSQVWFKTGMTTIGNYLSDAVMEEQLQFGGSYLDWIAWAPNGPRQLELGVSANFPFDDARAVSSDSLLNYLPNSFESYYFGFVSNAQSSWWEKTWLTGPLVYAEIRNSGQQYWGAVYLQTNQNSAARDQEIEKMGAAIVEDYLSFSLYQAKQAPPPALLSKPRASNETWLITLDELTILADSKEAIKRWIDAYVVGDMGGRPRIKSNSFSLSSERVPEVLNQHSENNGTIIGQLVKESEKRWLLALNSEDKAEIVAQSSSTALRDKSQLAWEYELDAPVAAAPRAVKGLNGKLTGEILVQDSSQQVVLLDQSGRRLWSKYLDEWIISDVWRLTWPSNPEEVVYVFSTNYSWQVYRKDGEDYIGFPKEWPGRASSGIQVVDFEDPGRFFVYVNLEGGRIYGFDQTATPLRGWTPRQLNTDALHPIQHLQTREKDFLFVSDASSTIYVLARDGQMRFDSIQFSQSLLSPLYLQKNEQGIRMVSLDVSGRIRVVDTSGQHFPILANLETDVPNFLAYGDFSGDTRFDYALANSQKIWLKAYEGNQLKDEYHFTTNHRIDTLSALPGKGKELLVALDKQRGLFSIWQGDQLYRPDMPLAGETLPHYLGNGRYVVGYRGKVYAYDF